MRSRLAAGWKSFKSRFITRKNGSRLRKHAAPRFPSLAAQIEPLEPRQLLTVTFHGGAVLASVETQAVYLGSDWATNSALQNQAAATDQFLSTIVQSPYMDMLTNAGYNVGRGSAFAGAVDNVALNKTTGITDAQIRGQIQSLINSGQLRAPDANSLYVVNVEPGVVVYNGTAASNTSFLGYHAAFGGTTAAGAPITLHYAVIPAPGAPNFSSASQGFNSDFDEITSVTSHELAESATDPNVNYALMGWYDDQNNGEIADLTRLNTTMSGYLVQDVVNQNDQPVSPPAAVPTPAPTSASGPFHFEFGTPTSPVAAGYTAVNQGTLYSAAQGYGWQSGTVSSRDDTTPGLTTIQRGYDYTKAATFGVALANGTYNVTVTMGDEGWMHDLQGVILQGTQVDSVTTAAGQFYTHTYVATVANGQLTLALQDLGGSDPNVVINALDIVQTTLQPPVSSGASHFEFGTPTSPVAAGYTAINEGTSYTAAQGYGWQSGTVSSRDDTTPGLTTIQRGYDYTKGATFGVALANGTYNVTVTMGDAGWMHDQQGVFLQGTQVDTVTTQVGQFYTHTYVVTVTNGQLTLKLQDLGGSDPNVVINALDIVPVA